MIKCVRARDAVAWKGLLSTANARISLGVTDVLGFSALAGAAALNSVSMVVALLRAGASANLLVCGSMTPLYIAAQEGHRAVVEALVRAGVTVDQANANGLTPLYVASHNGRLTVVE